MRSAQLAIACALAAGLAPSSIPPVAKRISAAHVDKYRRDGVVVIRGVADAATVELLRRAVADCVSQPGPYAEDLAPGSDAGPNYFTDLELATRHAVLRDFAETGAAAAVAARLMESRTSTFFYDQLFVKHAANDYARNATTPWHADVSYWALRGGQIASVAIALDDHDAANSLAFAVGSHTTEEELAPVQFATGERYDAARDLPTAAAPASAVQFELSAGDAVVFDGRSVHGGPGCFGRSLALRFVGDDVVFDRARFDSGRCAIPTSDPGLADGAPLASERFPLCFVDPLFKAFSTPVSVVEWSKGVAVSEEQGDFPATPREDPEITEQQKRRVREVLDRVYGGEDSEEYEERRGRARASGEDDATLNLPKYQLVYGELGLDALATILDAVQVQKGDRFLDIGHGDGVLVASAALLYPDHLEASVGVELVPELHARSLEFQSKWPRDAQAKTELLLGDVYEPDDATRKCLSETTVAVCFATTWSGGAPGKRLPRLSEALGSSLPAGARLVIVDGVLDPAKDGYDFVGELKLFCPDTSPYSTARLYTKL